MAKYKPKRDLPLLVRQYKTFSPTILRQKILEKHNRALTPESITNWFRRNPQVEEQLKKEVIELELPKEEVNESVFKNGTFEEFPSIKNWLVEQKDRDLSATHLYERILILK
jgi:hypothetical protein